MSAGISAENTITETHRYFQALFAKNHRELEDTKKSKPGLIGYGPVFAIAIFKDLIDFTGVGSLPGIGTIITLCFSFIIFLLLLLTRSNKKLVDSRFLLRMGVVLILGTLAEWLFGLNFLPIETITIGIIYLMDRHLSDQQIAKITGALHTLHGEHGSALRAARQAERRQQAEDEVEERQQAANDAHYQQKAANDAEYQNNPVRRVA